ncbi:MAG: tRNA (guanosine(37)-N1)-methyltransferase TrmD [bacterium]
MTYHILTIFPQIFDSYFNETIIKRAREKNIISINPVDIRNFTTDKHRTVDDKPYGGGAGMVMKPNPIYEALSSLKLKSKKKKIILLTPAGKKFDQRAARRLSKYDELIFICGRYEGIDARIEKFVDEKISIGDYVLTGGELPAMVIIDAVTRLLPGVLGNIESPKEESHSDEGVMEYPQYTRPEIFEAAGKKLKVPKILLSGDHKKIEEWRRGKMMER